jgi:hypothetical protein
MRHDNWILALSRPASADEPDLQGWERNGENCWLSLPQMLTCPEEVKTTASRRRLRIAPGTVAALRAHLGERACADGSPWDRRSCCRPAPHRDEAQTGRRPRSGGFASVDPVAGEPP